MSKTPRTDENEILSNLLPADGSCFVVKSSVARQIEAELAEAKAEIERLKYNLACADQAAENQEAEKEFDLESMRRLIACKDKLIEQMCEALKTVVSSAPPSGPLWHGSAEIEKAVAAIKAAERGE